MSLEINVESLRTLLQEGILTYAKRLTNHLFKQQLLAELLLRAVQDSILNKAPDPLGCLLPPKRSGGRRVTNPHDVLADELEKQWRNILSSLKRWKHPVRLSLAEPNRLLLSAGDNIHQYTQLEGVDVDVTNVFSHEWLSYHGGRRLLWRKSRKSSLPKIGDNVLVREDSNSSIEWTEPDTEAALQQRWQEIVSIYRPNAEIGVTQSLVDRQNQAREILCNVFRTGRA